MGKLLGLLLMWLGFFLATYAEPLLNTFINASVSAFQVIGTLIMIVGSFVVIHQPTPPMVLSR